MKLEPAHTNIAFGVRTRAATNTMGIDEGTRWRVVEAYQQTGNYQQVAKRFGCHVTTVHRWVQRFSHTGGVKHNPRSGRPGCVKPGDEQEGVKVLLQQGVRQHKKCNELKRDLEVYLGVQCSKETVRRMVRELASQRRPVYKPLLTDRHKAARLAFAMQWVDQNHDVLAFSDSKYFYLNQGNKGYKVWVLHEDETPRYAAYSHCTKKVHAYAVVTKFGLSDLFFTIGTTSMRSNPYTGGPGVNYQVYMDLLENKLIPAARRLFPAHMQRTWIWQQDGARPHTAKATLQKLNDMGVRVLEKWPAKSPDLSWIENLWALVSRKVNERSDVTSDNFEQVIRQEWAKVQQPRVFRPFADSINKRLKACIANAGGETKY